MCNRKRTRLFSPVWFYSFRLKIDKQVTYRWLKGQCEESQLLGGSQAVIHLTTAAAPTAAAIFYPHTGISSGSISKVVAKWVILGLFIH